MFFDSVLGAADAARHRAAGRSACLHRIGLVPFLRTIDLVLAEQRELAAAGPHLTIWHRFQVPGTECMPGEEIWTISLDGPRRHVPLKLSLAIRILLDYLAHHRHIPQSASQIEAGIRSDPFYTKHGSNVRASTRQMSNICRSLLKVYVPRFHDALENASVDAGLMLDLDLVLISEPTDGNELLYRLKARVDWRHIPLK